MGCCATVVVVVVVVDDDDVFARYNEADESRKMSWRDMQHAPRNKKGVQNLGRRTCRHETKWVNFFTGWVGLALKKNWYWHL